jgi:hypothetical protein
MSINFFDINGAGSGGGGGGTVLTENGISGDGSAGSPVALGGNPLVVATIIDAAGNDFSLTGANSIDLEAGGNAVLLDSAGLTGNALFAISGNPNQYVQAGNLPAPGGTVLTGNGVSGDGSAGAPVILGGALAGGTVIDTTGQTLSISNGLGGSGLYLNEPFADFVQIISIDSVTGDGAFFTVQGNAAGGVAMFISNAGNTQRKSIEFNQGPVGLEVRDDFSNVGLIGTSLFPVSGDPNQYVQQGNLSGSFAAATDLAGQSATQTIVTYTLPNSDAIIRVNAYALWRSGLGSVAVTVQYVDALANAVTKSFGASVALGNIDTSFPALVIKARGLTTVDLIWTITGAGFYDGGGVIESLFA